MSQRSEQLISGWLQGTLSEEDFSHFQKLLLADPALRQRLRREISLDMVLQEQAGVGAALRAWSPVPERMAGAEADAAMSSASPLRIPSTRRWLLWATSFVTVLILAGGAFLWGHRQGVEQETLEETNLGCAILTKTVNAEWLGDEPMLRNGDTLKAGTLKLACGFAQIEFFSGATLLMEGDAELVIISPWEAVCHSGKVRVRVPPSAHGFQLHAPEMRLVDLGTEFGLQVSPEDATSEVHVFEGEVEAHPRHTQLVSLKQGEGLRCSSKMVAHLAGVKPDHFMCLEQMDTITAKRARQRQQAWATWRDHACADARLVAFYGFDQMANWERLAPNIAHPVTASRHGGIVGARWTQGRWPTKTALEFKRPGDRVRMRLDGEHDGLTFACWVKVDGLDRRYNALLLTDGYETGEPHWQILEDGRLMFSIAYPETGRPENKINQVYYSPVTFTRSNLGRWHHLAVTYDPCSGEAVQFLDGREISRESAPLYEPGRKVVYGQCEIGNWGLPARGTEFPIRNLNGCLDEFAIYNTALNPADIKSMFESGLQD